jgi:hypothetical protein
MHAKISDMGYMDNPEMSIPREKTNCNALISCELKINP